MKPSTSGMGIVFLVTLAATLAFGGVAAAEAPADRTARTLVASLNERPLDAVRDRAYVRYRHARIRDLLCETLDLDVLGRFVLGGHWSRMSRGQRRDFMDLFAEAVVRHAFIIFGPYTGETFNVIAVVDDGPKPKMIAITVNVMRTRGPLLAGVDDRLREDWGNFQNIDIVGGGVSMALTLKKQYTAEIDKAEGKVDGLLEALRRSIAWQRVRGKTGAGCQPATPQ